LWFLDCPFDYPILTLSGLSLVIPSFATMDEIKKRYALSVGKTIFVSRLLHYRIL